MNAHQRKTEEKLHYILKTIQKIFELWTFGFDARLG